MYIAGVQIAKILSGMKFFNIFNTIHTCNYLKMEDFSLVQTVHFGKVLKF